MDFSPHTDEPMTREEVTRLADFLSSDAVPEETLTIDELDGFMAALVCSPDLVPPSEWMPVVWGGEWPSWDSMREAREILGLTMQLWNNCAQTINAGSGYIPILTIRHDESGEDVPAADGWCYGFALGIRLRDDLWSRDRSRKLRELLGPIRAFLENERRADAGEPLDDSMSDDALVHAIPPMVHGLRAYWLEKGASSPGENGASKPRSRRSTASDSRGKKPLRAAKKRRTRKK
jgi:uncharacterized protein